MKPTPGSCLVVLGSLIVTIVWLVLLLSSLFFAPKKKRESIIRPRTATPDPAPATMRLLERMLIVTSVLMILTTLAFYLGVRAMQP
jgi:hypothetical protein